MTKPDRMRRVDEAIREVLGDVIQHGELKDPRIGFATVTGVRTSSDLSHATVLVSVLRMASTDSGASTPEDTMDGLRSAVGFLQRRVGQELGLKHTPQLRFELDETVDRALRIQEILDDPPAPPVPSEEELAGEAGADAQATAGAGTTPAERAPTRDDAPR